MNFTKREITKNEHKIMLEDFRKIEIMHDVPEINTRRLNVTVEEGGEIIAFASGLTNRKWFNLTDLWVHENYRRQGLGAKTLKILEDDAKSAGMEHIYTWTTGFDKNDIFYQKQGYKIMSTLEDFFEVPGGHHFLLKKEL